MKMAKWVVLVLLLYAGATSGLAIYDLNVEATLFPVGGETDFPPAYDAPPGGPRNEVPITNRLGWGRHSGTTGSDEGGEGNYVSDGEGTETPSASGFPLGGPHGTVYVSGAADSPPNSFAFSEAWVNNMSIRLANRGDQDLWIDWVLDVSWNVLVHIDDPAMENAFAGFYVEVAGAGVNARPMQIWEANRALSDSTQLTLSFLIPKKTVRTVVMNMHSFGSAESESPLIPNNPPPPPPPPFIPPDEPITEPATGMLLGVGAIMAAYRRSRRED